MAPLADRLGFCEPVEHLSTRIPFGYATVQVPDEDGFERETDQRRTLAHALGRGFDLLKSPRRVPIMYPLIIHFVTQSETCVQEMLLKILYYHRERPVYKLFFDSDEVMSCGKFEPCFYVPEQCLCFQISGTLLSG